jgi:hypothetical protein
MFYLLLALQVVDAVTTAIGLQRPNIGEANKFAKFFIDRIGIYPTIFGFKGAVVAVVVYYKDVAAPETLGLLCLMYLWVCWNNLKLFRG